MIEVACVTTSISLSCEEYTNQGGTYEIYKKVIESIIDARSYCGMMKLQCDHAGINNNPAVTFLGGYDPDYAAEIIDLIEIGICDELGLAVPARCLGLNE